MAQAAQAHHYRLIVNDQNYECDDPVLTGRDILAIAGCRPASAFTTIVFAGLGTQIIGLDEAFEITGSQPPKFRTFKGDRMFRAVLNEREIVWGDKSISAAELRIIGGILDDEDLFFDSGRERPIDDDEILSLRKEGVERFRSGAPRDQSVDIVLNGEVISVDKGRLSFSELAKLAFPKLFGRELICFTVSFTRGPKRRSEGVLLDGDKVRIVEGMVFNVSATDKS
ncbi:multiubiquitin domain-containing protein [Roseibium sediminicola]|uniref:Multiubiquitin domain-containing protein n=1 Tax=Roseibium sediminicola TaxID=2933272 RepID=A0ABT0GZZ2_9HYPH|nr:multiubiquitin domain-containing protein [Roseibium sp. CAU 1639]MCK7615006.1 multiubiquitin domain-containing protein [Roseibium sp. CAU 1639]